MTKINKGKLKREIIFHFRNVFYKDGSTLNLSKDVIGQIAENILNREYPGTDHEEKSKVIAELVDDLTGFGPIEPLLKDQQITEIMINGPKSIYIEKAGQMQLTNIVFEDDTELMYFVNKMLEPTRRHIDETFPFTDISLNDGSRVNIVIPPLALNGPIVTIRKFMKEISKIDDLINLGTMDRRMADFLIACIKAKINIIFSGATGVGKTTTLNVLSSYIGNSERIVTIEDTAELRLMQEHVVRLETRNPNIEGKGEITIRDLFKNSLRMRPDRIILGEIRSSEALDMLQAICSGHRGSLAVLHANSPQDVIYRIETMILSSGIQINLEAIHRQMSAAINLIVQQEQLPDGSRKIINITQANGLRNGQVLLEDIFVYDLESMNNEGKVQGKWRATGVMPVFFPLFKKIRIDLPESNFEAK